jgi:hypothetical protein
MMTLNRVTEWRGYASFFTFLARDFVLSTSARVRFNARHGTRQER